MLCKELLFPFPETAAHILQAPVAAVFFLMNPLGCEWGQHSRSFCLSAAVSSWLASELKAVTWTRHQDTKKHFEILLQNFFQLNSSRQECAGRTVMAETSFSTWCLIYCKGYLSKSTNLHLSLFNFDHDMEGGFPLCLVTRPGNWNIQHLFLTKWQPAGTSALQGKTALYRNHQKCLFFFLFIRLLRILWSS